jgi:phosphoglycerol transferase MdoB-like AlkP superfamily enzyme
LGLRPPYRFLLTLVILTGCYLVCRVVFVIWNHSLFTYHGPAEVLSIFGWGVRMDLAAIALLNLPVFLLFSCAQYFSSSARPDHAPRGLLLAGRIIFVSLNGIGIALNLLDTGYFPFSKHRSNLDLWYVAGGSAGSFGSVLRIYFPLLILFLLSIWLLVKLSGFLFQPHPTKPPPLPALPLAQLALLLLLLLFIRGWQPRPLIPSTPLLDLDADKLPLAQNSVITMTYSLLKHEHQLTPKNYFSPRELDTLVSTRHVLEGKTGDSLDKKNVVLFILESFSRCYIMPGARQKAHTPFLDSLIRKSLFFPHAFANGLASNQGIVAILGGLLSLTDEPFFYSTYANTRLHSLGNILKEKGYNTNFFMGADRDHFGFGKFTRMAGFDHGYWQNDFNDDRFYDGNWGIFDEPFLQYGAHVLSSLPQPVLAVFFTISAHPPYTIPHQYRQRFDLPGQSPAQRSIAYTDYALQQFFATARNMPWFKHTLFVFCADHWRAPDDATNYSYADFWNIPIFIYDPAQDAGRQIPAIAGQVDLTPTILDLLHYRGSYSGFGRSLLDTTIAAANRYVFNKTNGGFQLISDQYMYGYDPLGDKGLYLYHYTHDSTCVHDLLTADSLAPTRKRLEKLLKAYIQRYSQALIKLSLD